jgi:2-keto-3-deoxy-6-phosphogluconate aldolase
MQKYLKMLAAVVGAGLMAAVTAYSDNVITVQDKLTIAISVVTAANVFAAPNVWGAMYTKTILAALGAVLVFVTSAITDGISTSEWYQIGVVALTATGVWLVPNRPDEAMSALQQPPKGK